MEQAIELGPRFDEAFALACELHRGQPRKGTKVPYIAHLMSVAALALEATHYCGYEAAEDIAIGALFHDAIEDQGHKISLETIREKFGRKVHEIVSDCSDANIQEEGQEKAPWHERKQAYVSGIRHKSRETLIVSCADKLHNARSMMYDYDHTGERFWDRFNSGKEDQLWYYSSLLEAFKETWPENPLLPEFAAVVKRMEQAIEGA